MRKFLLFASLLLILAACKPSEKNYRLAYETAQARNRAGLEDGVYELMQQEALPPMIKVMGDSVRIERKPLTWYYTPQSVDSGAPMDAAPYNLAIALFKMPTNAKARADELAELGYRSRVFKSGKEAYYVMAGTFSTLDSVAHASSDFISKYPKGCIGLPCPIAIQSLR